MSEPTRSIKLYGTDQPIVGPRVLKAGALSAELEAGNLRHIRLGGVEVIRAISYIVRDKDWATYSPVIFELEIDSSTDRFEVSYSAAVSEGATTFHFRASIVGTPHEVAFKAIGRSDTGFLTNRTGFVVLHPVVGVAGRPVTIEHVNGSIEKSRFPEIINPLQPMMELRALTHEPAAGLRVSCRMEGDTFEMEDQRNWTDASYKTYVRPLALPWPYELPAGEEFGQSVTLRFEGHAERASATDDRIQLRLGGEARAFPPVGVGFHATEIGATRACIDDFKRLGPKQLVCHYDPRFGDDIETLRAGLQIAQAIGAEPWLEAVIVQVAGFERELADLGRAAASLDAPFAVMLLSPAADLRGTLPGSQWPPAPPAQALYAAARTAFPHSRLGGGMFSFFTELNRKRPPLGQLDLVSFTTSAVVHAGDDRTVMENLEALPFVASSVRQIAGALPYSVGPSAIGMRLNPYGEAPIVNAANIRQAMNRDDPRQRGLLGAAWMLAYCASFARGGASTINFGGTIGAFGLVHSPAAVPHPYFDHAGGVFPAYHVLRALARLANHPMIEVSMGDSGSIAAVGARIDGATELILANLTASEQKVALPFTAASMRVLDAKSFVSAAADPAYLDKIERSKGDITLDAFAVVRVVAP